MRIVKEACNEMQEIIYEAKEHAKMALYYRDDYPSLSASYIDIANQELAQAEKLHTTIVAIIDKLKTNGHEVTEDMMEMWKMEHKLYIDKYEQAKFKISMYQKY